MKITDHMGEKAISFVHARVIFMYKRYGMIVEDGEIQSMVNIVYYRWSFENIKQKLLYSCWKSSLYIVI